MHAKSKDARGLSLLCVVLAHPQVPVLKSILASATSLLFQRVEDRFELCMAQCRTSSSSVVHENMYINSEHKFCVERGRSDNAGRA